MASTQFYSSSESFFNDLLYRLEQAHNYIVLEYYIFDEKSEIGKQVLERLQKANDRGVQIFLRLDGIGSRHWLNREELPMRINCGEISVFNPAPWPISRFVNSELPRINQFLKYWSKVNHRNHKKLCIVDGQFAFVGSMNIQDQAFAWIECGLQVEGPVVDQLLKSFLFLNPQSVVLKRAAMATEILSTSLVENLGKPEPEVFLQYNRSQRSTFRKRHRRAFSQATQNIFLVTPYFVPSLWLVSSLIRARHRGVRVQLLLSKTLDYRFMNWLIDKYLYPLIESGIEVYKLDKMVHAKIVVIDNWIHLGSSNLNQRSFHLDMELNVEVKNSNLQTQVHNFILDLIEKAQSVDLQMLNQRPWFEKIVGSIMQIFKRFL